MAGISKNIDNDTGVILYGGGGHAKVIYDALVRSGQNVVGFFDDNPDAKLWDLPHLGGYTDSKCAGCKLIIAIGDNFTRQSKVENVRHQFGKLSDPSALVSGFSRFGEGTVVLHNVVVQANVNIGSHVIINTSAVVDHDSTIGDFSHIGPNATLCGEVKIGSHCLIGAGAVVLPGARVPDNHTVKAGEVYK